jgi:hypothetical protein
MAPLLAQRCCSTPDGLGSFQKVDGEGYEGPVGEELPNCGQTLFMAIALFSDSHGSVL